MIPLRFVTTCSAHSSPSTLPPCRSISLGRPCGRSLAPSACSDVREIWLRSLTGAKAARRFPDCRLIVLIWLSVSHVQFGCSLVDLGSILCCQLPYLQGNNEQPIYHKPGRKRYASTACLFLLDIGGEDDEVKVLLKLTSQLKYAYSAVGRLTDRIARPRRA